MSMYLVTGDNGAIIQWTYSGAYRCRHYFKHSLIRKYDTAAEAEQAAWEHLSEVLPSYIPVPEKIGINDMLTVKKLIQEYEAKEGHYCGKGSIA